MGWPRVRHHREDLRDGRGAGDAPGARPDAVLALHLYARLRLRLPEAAPAGLRPSAIPVAIDLTRLRHERPRCAPGDRAMAIHIGKATAATLLLAALPHVAMSQSSVPVNGVAFDSLRGQPLKEALIKIIGLQGTATTDDRGRFRFDSVSPGVRTFIVQHPLLDSAGFPGISRRA